VVSHNHHKTILHLKPDKNKSLGGFWHGLRTPALAGGAREVILYQVYCCLRRRPRRRFIYLSETPAPRTALRALLNEVAEL